MIGRIFDIQRFSVHDGPGIRTTVFMKGCPLRCRWCHNPEGLCREPQLWFSEEKCISCGACGKRAELSDADNCPSGALTVCGRDITAAEALEEVLRDKIFYAGGGGLTLSGGECLCQADFVYELLCMAKEQGIHTAVDTSGYAPWETFERILEVCDLYLYDVKCSTASLHREFTGVDNALIIENLKRLSALGKDICVRIPVIPDFNDNEGEMTAIADMLCGLGAVREITLMPYHTLGASKYKALGLEYAFDTSRRISDPQMAAFARIFKERGFMLS